MTSFSGNYALFFLTCIVNVFCLSQFHKWEATLSPSVIFKPSRLLISNNNNGSDAVCSSEHDFFLFITLLRLIRWTDIDEEAEGKS